MFTGIIRNTAKIHKIIKKNKNCVLELTTKLKFNDNEIDSSISCSGTCLTLEKISGNLCSFYLSKETLNRSNFKFKCWQR